MIRLWDKGGYMGKKSKGNMPIKGDYIVDDRLNMKLLREDIEKMTEKEFEEFLKMVERNGKYPNKYSLTGNWK